MIYTNFRKHVALTLILTLLAGTTLIALCSFACATWDRTYMDKDVNLLGGWDQFCKNTEKSAFVFASVWKSIDYKWVVIPYLYVSTYANARGIDVDKKSGTWSLDCYVEGSGIERKKSDSFRGPFSKNHDADTEVWFGSPSTNVRNEADAEVSHDQDSDVSTASLSI